MPQVSPLPKCVPRVHPIATPLVREPYVRPVDSLYGEYKGAMARMATELWSLLDNPRISGPYRPEWGFLHADFTIAKKGLLFSGDLMEMRPGHQITRINSDTNVLGDIMGRTSYSRTWSCAFPYENAKKVERAWHVMSRSCDLELVALVRSAPFVVRRNAAMYVFYKYTVSQCLLLEDSDS